MAAKWSINMATMAIIFNDVEESLGFFNILHLLHFYLLYHRTDRLSTLLLFYENGGEVMLNQVVLVGRICQDPELRVTKSGRKLSYITLACKRPYKNAVTGEYDTDFF